MLSGEGYYIPRHCRAVPTPEAFDPFPMGTCKTVTRHRSPMFGCPRCQPDRYAHLFAKHRKDC